MAFRMEKGQLFGELESTGLEVGVREGEKDDSQVSSLGDRWLQGQLYGHVTCTAPYSEGPSAGLMPCCHSPEVINTF